MNALTLNKSAALRILTARSLNVVSITEVREVKNVILVRYNVRGNDGTVRKACQFVSKKSFLAEFNRVRNEKAQTCRVTHHPVPGKYSVRSAEGQQVHVVEVSPKRVGCDCRDYEQQFAAWGKGFCCHLRAVALKTFHTDTFGELVKQSKGKQPIAA